MNAEPGKYSLTSKGRRQGYVLNNESVVGIYDQNFNLIDVIYPPDPELTTFQALRRQVIEEALAEDAAREGSPK
jgi:hypothetical protein